MEEKYIDYGKVRPTIDDSWSKNNSYETLTFVKYGSKLYISKKDVPKDIELNNEEYWLLLIDGGELVTKEDKSNKKNSLDYTDETYYPTVVAVKNAIRNLNVDAKLNCYWFNGISNNVCIKKERYSFNFLLSIVDFDNPENNSFYYVDDNENYTLLGRDEVWFDFQIHESHTEDENHNILDTYIHLDFDNSNEDLEVQIIPLGTSSLEIEQDVKGLIVDSTFELIHLNENVDLRKNVSGGIQQINCNASGTKAFAIGDNTVARNNVEVACGKNNISILNKTAHTIGIGSSFSSRKNAQLITVDGKHYIPGIGRFTGEEATISQLNGCDDLATFINNLVTTINSLTTTINSLTTIVNNFEPLIIEGQLNDSDPGYFEPASDQSSWDDAKNAFFAGRSVYIKYIDQTVEYMLLIVECEYEASAYTKVMIAYNASDIIRWDGVFNP